MVPPVDSARTYEIEVKFRLADADGLRRRLAALGFAPAGRDEQEDVYFRHPGRDFAQTHEAFRLRRHGDENRLTYKGPKQAGPTKTREEIEVRFEDGPEAREQMLALLGRLGFEPVAAVRKHREAFTPAQPDRMPVVVIDEVEGLGTFAEIEAIAECADELPTVQAGVLELANRLGLDAVEPRSYLRLWLEHQGKSPGRG